MSVPEILGYVVGGSAGFVVGLDESGWYELDWFIGLVCGSLAGGFALSAFVVLVADPPEPLSRFQERFTPRTRGRAAIMLIGATGFGLVFNRGPDAPPKALAIFIGIFLSRAAVVVYENWWGPIRGTARATRASDIFDLAVSPMEALPGASLRVRVDVSQSRAIAAVELRAYLKQMVFLQSRTMTSRGRGEDSLSFEEEVGSAPLVDVGSESEGRRTYVADLGVPRDAPASAGGEIVSVEWRAGVELRIPRDRDVISEKIVRVRAPEPLIAFPPDSSEEAANPIQLGCPPIAALGGYVRGEVIVRPAIPSPARVLVELLRVEQVLYSDQNLVNERMVVVSTTTISIPSATTPVRFELKTPDEPPTVLLALGSLRWLVRASLPISWGRSLIRERELTLWG